MLLCPMLVFSFFPCQGRACALNRTTHQAHRQDNFNCSLSPSPCPRRPSLAPPAPSKARWGSGLQKWVTDRLITRIVDSLQVHIREVHVRYEVGCGGRGGGVRCLPLFALPCVLLYCTVHRTRTGEKGGGGDRRPALILPMPIPSWPAFLPAALFPRKVVACFNESVVEKSEVVIVLLPLSSPPPPGRSSRLCTSLPSPPNRSSTQQSVHANIRKPSCFFVCCFAFCPRAGSRFQPRRPLLPRRHHRVPSRGVDRRRVGSSAGPPVRTHRPRRSRRRRPCRERE